MRWLTLSVVMCILVVVTSNQNQLRCQNSDSYICSRSRNGRFFLDGHKVHIKHIEDTFSVECDGWEALDFQGLPRFTIEVQVPVVRLIKCPLPATRSLVDVLTSFNVKLLQPENDTTLVLSNLPPEPQLATTYFVGLEHLKALEIKAQTELTSSVDFLGGLKNLRSLKLTRVSLLGNSGPRGQRSVFAVPATLEKLQLVDWQEEHPATLESCDSLLQLDLYKPNIETLPERWVAACPRLEKITLKSADNLVSLPSNLLEGANELKRLTISKCKALKSLPERFLARAPSLFALDLSHNSLQTLPSNVFMGPNLLTLVLYSNRLQSEALEALTPLTSLIKLDLGHNQNLKNLCDENGYSSLKDMFILKELSFHESGITHICRDWRENMTLLASLDLRDTDIKELTFADLQYIRDPTLKNPKVTLDDAAITGLYNAVPQITSITFTEEDYKKALKTPATDSSVQFIWSYDDLQCDCKMYWTRKAMDIPNFKTVISMDRVQCNKKGYLKDLTAEQICPERA